MAEQVGGSLIVLLMQFILGYQIAGTERVGGEVTQNHPLDRFTILLVIELDKVGACVWTLSCLLSFLLIIYFLF